MATLASYIDLRSNLNVNAWKRTEIDLNESEIDLNKSKHFLKTNLDQAEIDPSWIDLRSFQVGRLVGRWVGG